MNKKEIQEAGKQLKNTFSSVQWIEFAKCFNELEAKAEVKYLRSLESSKHYFAHNGLDLPEEFKEFWLWYLIHYENVYNEMDLIDNVKRHLVEYSRVLTEKLDYKPLFKYQPPLMREPDKLYYLKLPHEAERTKEIKQFILHIHNRINEEVKGLTPYHFDIHKFLSIQGITADLKAEILAEVHNTLIWFPPDKRQDIEQIKAIINDYQPPQSTPHNAERLTLKQIALIYAYEGKYITDQNSNDIAKEYGYKSGHKLKQEFDYYRKPLNRKGIPRIVTNKTIQNKINLLNSVLPYLTDNNKSKVNDEVTILETSLIA